MRKSLFGVVASISAVLAGCQVADPTLSSTAQESISTSTPTVTFPNTQVGTTSGAIQIQINPVGYTYNEIVAINEACPDFAIQWSPGYAERTCDQIEPCVNSNSNIEMQCPIQATPPCSGGSQTYPYYFTATFTPNVVGTSSCNVAVVSNNTININLTGTGTAPPLSADVVPTNYGFGDVRVNTASSPTTVTVRNTGGQNLTVSNVTTGGAFSLTDPAATSFTLVPGATRGIGVRCTPTAVGGTSGSLSIANNYATLTTSLSCNGIDSNLDISPSPLTLPVTRVGEPRTQMITLTNSGGAPMAIASVALTGAGIVLDSAPAPNTMLAGNGGTATATVTFPADASGEVSGMLTVMYDGGQARQAAISGRALSTSMSMSPNGSVDLGPVCIGQKASKTFQILANDQGPFQVSSVAMPSGPFSVIATNLPAPVQGAGASKYEFSVGAEPTEVGVQTAMLTVTTDIPDSEPQETAVIVEGLAEGVNGSPAELDLGAVPVGSNTVGQTVTITNCSVASVVLSNARIEGADAQEFSIVDFPSLDVEGSGNAEFLIIARPNSVGAKEALFKVDHPDGTITINLLGDGLGEQPGGDDDAGRPSYYACSTGSGAAAWPLAIAIGFAFARRRRR